MKSLKFIVGLSWVLIEWDAPCGEHGRGSVPMVRPLRTVILMSFKALLFFMLACLPVAAQGNPCPPLIDTEKAKIADYLSKWFGVPETEELSIARE
jgi:hypothetical protein